MKKNYSGYHKKGSRKYLVLRHRVFPNIYNFLKKENFNVFRAYEEAMEEASKKLEILKEIHKNTPKEQKWTWGLDKP